MKLVFCWLSQYVLPYDRGLNICPYWPLLWGSDTYIDNHRHLPKAVSHFYTVHWRIRKIYHACQITLDDLTPTPWRTVSITNRYLFIIFFGTRLALISLWFLPPHRTLTHLIPWPSWSTRRLPKFSHHRPGTGWHPSNSNHWPVGSTQYICYLGHLQLVGSLSTNCQLFMSTAFIITRQFSRLMCWLFLFSSQPTLPA